MSAAIALLGLLRKEFAQLFRDRVMMFIVFWLFVVESILCPLALTFDVRRSPLVVVDHDRSPASRALIAHYRATEAFDWQGLLDREGLAERLLDEGRVQMALIVPAGFQRALVRREPAQYQILLDGSNGNVAGNLRAYAHHINALFAEQWLRPVTTGPVAGGLQPRVRVWYNPAQSTTSFMALSMIALAGMMAGVALPAASLVREKEQGTIEQLLVTPLRPWQLFIAKTLPTLLLCLLAIVPAVAIVYWMFATPLRGSFALLLIFSAVFLTSAMALGVVIGVHSTTLQQALLLTFFGLFPILFLSGTVTPVESMPPFLQALSRLSPLRYYMEILLGIFLKGSGWRELWSPVLALVAMGVALFTVALWQFRRRYA